MSRCNASVARPIAISVSSRIGSNIVPLSYQGSYWFPLQQLLQCTGMFQLEHHNREAILHAE